MLGYFNLYKRTLGPRGKRKTDEELHADEFSKAGGGAPGKSLPRQLILYLGVIIGVIFSNSVTRFSEGAEPQITISLSRLIVSIIVTLVIVPQVYRRLDTNPDAPFLVQFGLFVQQGIFWHVIIGSISQIA
jgi:hypothetical protein